MVRENDWIIATMNNPNFTPEDFKNLAGMNLENTQLLDKDRYLKSNAIRQNQMFQTNGQFDEKKFDDFYAQQVQKFGEFTTENRIDNFEYDFWDTRRPKGAKIKKENFQMFSMPNPDHISIGMGTLNGVDQSEYSRKELAQRSKIFTSF